MIPASVEVNINEKAVKDYIQQKLDEQLHHTFLFVDIEKLAEITQMSKKFLEMEIIPDPRMKILERRRSRKRWWFYKEAMEAIREIVDEW